ncbi:MAG: hypothetical protein LUD69_05210, partial [Oscillospiraceae bacterium]|nr:hypothetical protein [Oscillospiraceae bacterium]
ALVQNHCQPPQTHLISASIGNNAVSYCVMGIGLCKDFNFLVFQLHIKLPPCIRYSVHKAPHSSQAAPPHRLYQTAFADITAMHSDFACLLLIVLKGVLRRRRRAAKRENPARTWPRLAVSGRGLRAFEYQVISLSGRR